MSFIKGREVTLHDVLEAMLLRYLFGQMDRWWTLDELAAKLMTDKATVAFVVGYYGGKTEWNDMCATRFNDVTGEFEIRGRGGDR